MFPSLQSVVSEAFFSRPGPYSISDIAFAGLEVTRFGELLPESAHLLYSEGHVVGVYRGDDFVTIYDSCEFSPFPLSVDDFRWLVSKQGGILMHIRQVCHVDTISMALQPLVSGSRRNKSTTKYKYTKRGVDVLLGKCPWYRKSHSSPKTRARKCSICGSDGRE